MTNQPLILPIDPYSGQSTPLLAIDPAPMPLARKTAPPTYPVDALGDLLGEAAQAFAYHVQTPLGMAAQSVLAVTSLAVQGHIDVKKGNLGTSPTTLYCLTIAASGDRKSSLDSLVMSPIYEYQAERREAYQDQLAEYRADLEAHELRYKSTIAGYRGKGQQPKPLDDDDQQALSRDLAELEKSRPKPPPRPHILMEEPTAEGVYKHFLEALAIGGLFSDEGGAFFSGHGMTDEAKGRSITMLSQLWDGKPITRTRAAAGESGVLAGRRLASHLMVQPIIANKVLSDPLMMGQGFLARFLVCSDESLAGKRFLASRDSNQNPGNDARITGFWSRLADLIRQPLATNDAGELTPTALEITGPALNAWETVHDVIEQQLSADGEYATIRPFAAKAADNIARIAAVLAYVETDSHPTPEHINRAAKVMQYYLNTMTLRTEEAAENTAEYEAQELADWIRQNGGELKADDFKKLPAAYRQAQKARALLALLEDRGHAFVTVKGLNKKPSAWKLREVHNNV